MKLKIDSSKQKQYEYLRVLFKIFKMIIFVVLLTFFVIYINYLIEPLESPLALMLIINAGILDMGIVFLILKLIVNFFRNGVPIELEIKESNVRVTYTKGKELTYPLNHFKAGQPLLNVIHANKYFIIYTDISLRVDVENKISNHIRLFQ